MIFLSEDAFRYMKREYIINCMVIFVNFACLYTIFKKVKEQNKEYNNLTKKIEELNMKGD